MPAIVAAIASWVAAVVAGGAAVATGVGSIALYSTVYAVTSMVVYGAISTIVSNAVGRMFYNSSKSSSDTGQISINNSGLLINSESAITSHRIIYGTRKAGGQLFLRDSSDSGPDSNGETQEGDNLFLHIMLALAGHECEEITTVYADDVALTLNGSGFATNSEFTDDDGKYYLRIKKHLGAEDQTADLDAVSEIENWTTAHRARGRTYIYIRMQYNADIFPNLPRFTALIKGKKVYDSRTSTTSWSNNSGLCIRDYLKSSYGLNVEDIELNDTYLIAAANVCDELVTLQDASTQKRYTCDTVLERNVQVIDNLQELISSFVGSVVYVQGKFRIHAGAYDTPSETITEDWLIDTVKVQARQSRKETFNAVKGIYINEDESYEPTDFTPSTNETYETQDGGERIYADVTFSCTTNQERAQRMAKVILEKSRQGIMLTLPVNFKGLKLAVWDTIYVTLDDLGWSNKIFRIAQWQINENGNGINLYCQEESSESYDWNSGEATIVDPAPDTNLTSPFDRVLPPGSPSVVEELYETTTGTSVKVKAIVSWTASLSLYLKEYELQYKLTSDTDYIGAGKRSKDLNSLTIFDIAAGIYNFRVRAINRVGKASLWATNVIQIIGLFAAPGNLTGLSLNAINNNAHLTWNASSDLDVKKGGTIMIKHTAETSGASWSTANIVTEVPGYSTSATVPLLDGTYLIKSVDSTGNQCVTAATISGTISNIVKMNVIATSTQDPTFPGTKTNMVVIDSNLRLDGSLLFDSGTGDFDDGGGLFDYGIDGYKASGTYLFQLYLDVGKVTTSRVTSILKALIYDGSEYFDQRSGLFDAQTGLFDGEDIDGLSVELFVRTTDDDPAGTPVWSDFRRFQVGDYTCRAYEFKVEVESNNTALNVDISSLSVGVDVPDIIDSGSSATISGGLKTISFNKIFLTTEPFLGFAINDMQTGDYTDVQNITATSFDIGIKDSGGTYVIRNFSYIAAGY